MSKRTPSGPDCIRCTVEQHVAFVVIDRPPVNAFDAGLFELLMRTFDILSERADVRAAVLTGAGRCFSAGVDLYSRPVFDAACPDSGRQHARLARECFHAIAECGIPVIAALNGPALGAGLVIAASCDILLAAEDASLGLPEIDVGLLGGGRHAMRLFGHSTARRMVFTGRRLDAHELQRLGVVEQCVPSERLLPLALDIAAEIAAKSQTAIRLAKRTMNAVESMGLRDGYRFEQEMTAELARSADSAEARNAFIGKRRADFGA